MESEHPISSRLKEAREAKNLSIAELSRLTNIRIHIIQALDEGRLEELPKVYMRSFIKRYAQSVGIASREIDELMNRYLAVETTPSAMRNASTIASLKSSTKSTVPIGRPAQRTRWLSILYSLLGLAVIGGLYYMYGPSKSEVPKQQSVAPSVVVSDKDSSTNVPATSGGLMTYFGGSPADSVTLEAVTTDTVWINITSDGKATEQITMHPHQTKKWVAAERFLLSIGNAGGVRLKRNGIDLPEVGKLGETVRSIRITKTEFVTSASPWKSQRDSVKAKQPAQQGTVKPGVKPSTPSPSPATPKNTNPKPPQIQPQNKQLNKPQNQPPTTSRTVPPAATSKAMTSTPAKTNVGAATVNKPGATITTKALPAAQTAAAAKRLAAQKKALLEEQIARKKRLERIRREASRKDITPVQIKP